MSGTEAAGIMEYFTEIEDYFCAQRSAPLLLSPLDFEKVVSWHDAGIPLHVVKKGVAEYFEKLSKRKTPLRRAICVSFAEDAVLKALEEHRQAMVGANCGMEAGPSESERKRQFISGLIASLENAVSRKDSFPGYSRSLAFMEAITGVLSSLLENAKVSLADTEGKLSPLDAELGRLIISETPVEQIAKWKEEAAETLVKAKITGNPAVSEAVEKKIMTKRAFAVLGAPRLSILYFNE